MLRGRRGRPARPGRASTAPRRTSWTRPTSAAGPAPSATPSPTTTSSTPARRSSAPTVARWIAEEGLCLDVCSGGELAVALRAGLRPGPDRLPRQQQVGGRAAPRARGRRRPDHRRLLRRDRPARRAGRRGLGTQAAVMVRVTAGVEAHTHEYIATAHEDQKFGFSISTGDAAEAARRVHARAGAASCSGCTATSARRSSTPPASRSPPAGCWPCTPQIVRRARRRAARARPRRRLRHRLHHPGRPVRPGAAGRRADQDRRARVPRARLVGAAAVVEPGRAIVGPVDVHALRGRHGQGRSSSTPARCAPTSPSTAG